MKRKASEPSESSSRKSAKMSRIELEKDKKYDRQIRLWGDHGQRALESCNVCLINTSATGTELLKNLVLPGIGSFTIVDGKKVSPEDVGNNFFFCKENIGKSRAECATELLLELNSDVAGSFIEEDPEDLLQNNIQFFKPFTVVVATNLSGRTLRRLGEVLWQLNVPLLVCRSYGMIGLMRMVVAEHTVIESHPDNAHEDLRLDRPFPGLLQYTDLIDLNSMTKLDHGHTPYLIILLKFLSRWKSEHDGRLPQNYREKDAFKKTIREGILKNKDGVPEDEENFDEAIKAVNSCLVPTKIPDQVRSILYDDNCSHITESSSPFWFLARAVREFAENEGNDMLPLRGSIPDMTSDSKRYIELQHVYQDQARQDMAAVTSHLHQLLTSVGKPADAISDAEIKLFCKNAYFLRVVRCQSLAEEYKRCSKNLVNVLDDPDSDAVYYVLLRAVDRFYEENFRYPGKFDDQVEEDIIKLKSCLSSLLQEWNLPCTIKDDCIHEMCRYGAAELHPVAAFIGGAGAQEVIKLITHQFVPFNNTYIYNAMTGTSLTVQV